MTYSLNELESLLKKAATGAGFPPGHAVDLAAAGVWLARRRVPVCDLLARSIRGGMCEVRLVTGACGVTCKTAKAAVIGIAAIDLLLSGVTGDAIELEQIDEPILLVGLAGVAAATHAVDFEIRYVGGVLSVKSSGVGRLDAAALEPGSVTLTLRAVDVTQTAPVTLASRYDPAAVHDTGWDELAALARKTYVPASEQSRLSGAGAGLTDND